MCDYLRGMLDIREPLRTETDTKKRTSEMLCRRKMTEK